jgi:hypothetical protein
MRFVAERIRPLYIAELADTLRRLILVGEGEGWLTPDEARLLRRIAFRAGMAAKWSQAVARHSEERSDEGSVRAGAEPHR